MEDSYGGIPVYGGFLWRIPIGKFLSMGDSCGGFLWGNSCLWGIPVEDSYGGIPAYGGLLWRIPIGKFLSMGDSCAGMSCSWTQI